MKPLRFHWLRWWFHLNVLEAAFGSKGLWTRAFVRTVPSPLQPGPRELHVQDFCVFHHLDPVWRPWSLS